jgi:hypothetical protein
MDDRLAVSALIDPERTVTRITATQKR